MRKSIRVFIEVLYVLLFVYTLFSCFEWKYKHNVGSTEFYTLEAFMGGVLVLTAVCRLIFRAKIKDDYFFVTSFLYTGLALYTLLGMLLQSESFSSTPVAAFYAPMALLRLAHALISYLLQRETDGKKAAGREILVVCLLTLVRVAFIAPFAYVLLLSGAVEIVLSLHIVYISAAICVAEILLSLFDFFRAKKSEN